MTDALDFCESEVREFARDRYLATLFAPAERRADLHALYAFDIEIARIPLLTHEPMAGEVRLQWWREALQGEREEEARANPVTAALSTMLARSPNVERAPLIAMLDARTADLYGDATETVAALAERAEAISGAVIRAAIQILSPDAPSRAMELSQPAGFVLGVSEIIRNVARDASRGKVHLPRDVMARHDVSVEDVVAGRNAEGLRAVLQDLSAASRERLALLHALTLEAQAEIGPAILPAMVMPLYLDRVDRRDFDPFHDVVDVAQWRRQWAMWRMARRFRSRHRD
jgi:phytoene synthase